MRFAVDANLLAGLQSIDFKPFCLITRLKIFNSRDQARNKENADQASLQAQASENASEDVVMSKKENVNITESPPVDPPLPVGDWSDEVEDDEMIRELEGIQTINVGPRAASCPIPLPSKEVHEEGMSGRVVATVGCARKGGRNASTKNTPPDKLPFYRRK